MIRIENVETFGWEAAIRGMRNPMNSWDRSDSKWTCIGTHPETCPGDCGGWCTGWKYRIGDNDLSLMKKLIMSGSDHRKFMRMILVTCDLTAPLYWWKEYDTYKVSTVANSCSTMHTIHKREFEIDDFSHEHLSEVGTVVLSFIVDALNNAREDFIDTNDKEHWWQIIQLLPSSYNQKRTVQLNYEVLRNMYRARKSHKLDEWRDFCSWIKTLPYSELITGEQYEN